MTIAGNDTAATDQGTAVEITVLANDSDEDGTLDPSTVAVQTGPGSGNAAVDAQGIVTYTPDAGFAGTDTFTYTVADDDGGTSNAATVVVTVTSVVVDDPPFAADDTAATEPGVAVEIDVLANDGDADGTLDPSTVVVQTGPDNGSTEVDEEGTVTYTPAADFAGLVTRVVRFRPWPPPSTSRLHLSGHRSQGANLSPVGGNRGEQL